jgi:hypothetical protein
VCPGPRLHVLGAPDFAHGKHCGGLREVRASERGRGRLRAVPPARTVRDERAEIARALLTRYAPLWPVISDEMLSFLGHDQEKQEQLEQDPRYIIVRLTQALSALLDKEVPPPDKTVQPHAFLRPSRSGPYRSVLRMDSADRVAAIGSILQPYTGCVLRQAVQDCRNRGMSWQAIAGLLGRSYPAVLRQFNAGRAAYAVASAQCAERVGGQRPGLVPGGRVALATRLCVAPLEALHPRCRRPRDQAARGAALGRVAGP